MVFMSTEWIEVSLKDICENKSIACKDFEAESIERYVGLEHLEPESLIISSWGFIKDGTTFTKLFYPGQVLFGKRRSYQKKAAVANFKGVCSGDILVLEANEEIILKDLLPYIIQNERLFDFAVGTSSGSLSPRTSWKHLSIYKVKIPKSKEQQQVILEKFIKLEQAIILKNKLIDSMKEYKRLLMERLLTKGFKHTEFIQTNLGEIPSSWTIKKIKDLATVITKGTSPSSAGFEFVSEGINFIKVESISKKNKIDEYNLSKITEECHTKFNRSIIEEDDLLMSIAGTLGRVTIVESNFLPANTNQALAIIRLQNKGIVKFLYYVLQSQFIQKKIISIATTGAQPNLSLKQVGDFEIPFPSTKERLEITNLLSSLDEQLGLHEKEKEINISLKKALQEELLSPREGVKI